MPALPPAAHDILARFEKALSEAPDAGQTPTIPSRTLSAKRLLVMAPAPFGLEFVFSQERFGLCLYGAPFATAIENPPGDRRYRILGPPPSGALPAPAIVFEEISYEDTSRIEHVLELISAATTSSAADDTLADTADAQPTSSHHQFGFDADRFAAWIARTSDPAHYRPCRGGEREIAQVIDELFADAQEAGAISPPADVPYLEIDVRQSRSCVLVMVGGKPDRPQLATKPIEVRHLARTDGRGTRHACEIVACLITRANELLGA